MPLEKKYFCSWSGGKESALSLYRAQQAGVSTGCLVTMVDSGAKVSRSHGIKSDLLKEQSQALRIPLIKGKASWKAYEKEFKKVIKKLKSDNFKGGIFGDIDIQQHRDWVERVCQDAGLKAILPLWQGKREELLKEFIQVGFKAIVVVVNSDFLAKQWLGRLIDEEFFKKIKASENIDLCGEKGEYHTFVYDGPIFQGPVKFNIDKITGKDKYWFLRLK